MANPDANNWKSIWDTKGQSVLDATRPGLRDLVREDGFDSGAGDFSVESWRSFSSEVYQRTSVNQGTQLLEVGCGCGAFLYPADALGASVFGVDYSHKLLSAAGKALPGGTFMQAEACALPYADNLFDAVISHSVFQYFGSSDYARRSIIEMVRVCKQADGCIAVLDVNDADKEEDFIRIRSGGMGVDAYSEKYADYPHRFYSKTWFADLLHQQGFEVEIVDQAIDGYQNSDFRFNVFARREKG